MSEETVDKAPEAPEAQEAPQRDYEAEARRDGWVNKEEWEAKGRDPNQHRSAQEFVEAGEKILPIIKGRLDKVEKELARTKDLMKQKDRAALEALKVQAEAYEAKVKKALAEAVKEGDGDRVVELQDRLGEAKEKVKAVSEELKAPEEPQVPPEFNEFLERNDWYLTI